MLGLRIASLRREAGLTQAALADRLNISPSAVGMYEQGRRIPSNDLLISLSAEFQVTTDYLLTGKACSQKDLSALSFLLLSSHSASLGKNNPLISKEELAVLVTAKLLEDI